MHFHLEGFYPVGYPPGFCREISNWYYPWHYPIGHPIILIGIRYWYYIIIIIIQLEVSFTGSTMRRISPWVLQRILSNRLKRHTFFWSVDRDHSSARASDDDLAVQKKGLLMGKWEGQTWKNNKHCHLLGKMMMNYWLNQQKLGGEARAWGIDGIMTNKKKYWFEEGSNGRNHHTRVDLLVKVKLLGNPRSHQQVVTSWFLTIDVDSYPKTSDAPKYVQYCSMEFRPLWLMVDPWLFTSRRVSGGVWEGDGKHGTHGFL